MSSINFQHPDLAQRIEAATTAERDALPFGAIKLDANGVVEIFNATEAQQSGYGDRPTVGRNFFLEIAPCMGVPGFKDRIESQQRAGRLDLEFGWVGDFNDEHREMTVRVQSAADGGIWIFLNRGFQ